MAEDHRAFEEELAAYLLDALTPEEAKAFHAHLMSCSRCQSEARWLRGAVEVLPSSVEQLEPPAELRERLMGAVRREAAAEQRPEPARRVARRPWLRVLRPAVALAGAAVIAAGLAGYLIRGGGEGAKTSTVAVAATAAGSGSGGSLVASGKTAVLQVHGLSLPRPGRVYEVWLMRGASKAPEPSTLFVVGRSGKGSASIPGGVRGVRQILVTLEPSGGSDTPTTKPLLQANLQ